MFIIFFFFSSRRRHTRCSRDWSSDVCSSDLSISHTASVIEAHIERGVAVSTADGYLRDKKLRIMVLRLRADLPALIADPLLPHRAASLALERARSGHIAYDFDMDYTDPSRLFCSEVASS